MSEPRPRPAYGEYATPEQQAAAMGRVYVPAPHPETRVAVPAPTLDQETTGTSLLAGGNLIDRFATMFQLGIGLVLLLGSDFFHFGENFNSFAARLGASQRISVAIDHYAWVLLAVNIVLLLATFAWAFATMRRGRLAFYIPVVGYLAFTVALAIAISVVG